MVVSVSFSKVMVEWDSLHNEESAATAVVRCGVFY